MIRADAEGCRLKEHFRLPLQYLLALSHYPTVGQHNSILTTAFDATRIELLCVEVGVQTIPGQQFLMGALFNDTPLIDPKDHIGGHDGG